MLGEISDTKIKTFQTLILRWYKEKGRKFIWRKKGLSNYQYIIAEALLQRTKAATVANFYVSFITEFPNWKSLALANLEHLEKRLMPIGLYRQRSIRLKNLALDMVKRNGRLPKNRKELAAIPFIGQYLANSIELV